MNYASCVALIFRDPQSGPYGLEAALQKVTEPMMSVENEEKFDGLAERLV